MIKNKLTLFILLMLFIITGINSHAVTKLELLGYFGGEFNDVTVNGSYAYVATGNGLIIFDVSNPSTPAIEGSLYTLTPANKIYYSDDTVYMVCGKSKLKIIDVADPSSPSLSGFYKTSLQIMDLCVSEKKLYFAESGDVYGQGNVNTFAILDVKKPSSPKLRGSYDLGEKVADSIFIKNKTVHLVVNQSIYIFDVNSPSSPLLQNTYEVSEVPKAYVSDSNAYIIDNNNLKVVDLSDTSSPETLGTLAITETISTIHVSGNTVFLSFYDSENEAVAIKIIDVNNPASPEVLSIYETNGSDLNNIYTGGTNTFLVNSNGLEIINTEDPALPEYSGSYATYLSTVCYISGSTAYFANEKYLQILDISNLMSPALLGSYELSNIYKIYVSENIAYVASRTGLQILDVSDPSSITLLSSYYGGYSTIALSAAGDRIYLGSYAILSIIDISDLYTPKTIGIYITRDGGSDDASPKGIYISGTRVYFCRSEGESEEFYLDIIDISDPTSPELINFIANYPENPPVFSGNKGYIEAYEGLVIQNFSNPYKPKVVGKHKKKATNLFVSEKKVYGLCKKKIVIMNCRKPSSPKLIASSSNAATLNWEREAIDTIVHASGKTVYLLKKGKGLRVYGPSKKSKN